jgi:hypothetical protein
VVNGGGGIGVAGHIS